GLAAVTLSSVVYVYVTNFGDDTVSVINTATSVVTTVSLPSGSGPLDVAVTPEYAYVADFFTDSISVISTTSPYAVTTPITSIPGPYAVAITPNGAYAFVTNYFSASVTAIDTSTNTVVGTISIGNYPPGVATAEASGDQYAYTSNVGSDSISVIIISPTVSASSTTTTSLSSSTITFGGSVTDTATVSGVSSGISTGAVGGSSVVPT